VGRVTPPYLAPHPTPTTATTTAREKVNDKTCFQQLSQPASLRYCSSADFSFSPHHLRPKDTKTRTVFTWGGKMNNNRTKLTVGLVYRGIEIEKLTNDAEKYAIYSDGGQCYKFQSIGEAHAFIDAYLAMSLFGCNVAIAPDEDGVID
jgi:hypothetical protein